MNNRRIDSFFKNGITICLFLGIGCGGLALGRSVLDRLIDFKTSSSEMSAVSKIANQKDSTILQDTSKKIYSKSLRK